VANNRTARRSFGRRAGIRRETLWLGGVTVRSTVATASTSLIHTSLNAAALALTPFTVVRVRGVLRLESDQLVATEFNEMAFGHAIVSEQAVAIGVTAVPTPVTDDNSDLWFVYEAMFNDIKVSSAIGILTQGVERIVDSRAMRKVEEGEDLIGVVETGATSAGVVMTTYTRALIKLH